MFWGREARYLEGWETFGQWMSIAAAATFVSAVQIRNPANSGVVAVLEKITSFNITAADTPLLNFSRSVTTDLPVLNGTPPLGIDTRGRPSANVIISAKNNDASTPGSQFLKAVVSGANIPYEWLNTDIQELPLLPGSAYFLSCTNVNTSMFASFLWRERVLEDSEKA
jgi:hypothetical protein